MKKLGIGKSGLPAMILLAGGILFAGFVGCSDNGTTVKVETTPSAAKVFIDGKFVGLSPCECFIRDSQPEDLWEHHVIEVQAKGFDKQSRRLRYRTGAAWLPDKIEFVMNPSVMIDEPDNPSPSNRFLAKSTKPAPPAKKETPRPKPVSTPAPKPEPVAVKKEAPRPAKPAPAPKPRRNNFRGATPWAKAAPLNDDNIPPAQKAPEKTKDKIKARHEKMEKIVVTTKGSRVVTAPKLPDVAPDEKKNENTKKEPVIAAARPRHTAVVSKPEYTEVPMTRSRLAPLPKQFKPQKPAGPQFVGSVPWQDGSAANAQSEIELVSNPVNRHVTKKPENGNGKNHSPAAPWLEAGGLGIEKPRPQRQRAAYEPQDERMFSCDLRIARVSDGVVLYQASGVDSYDHLEELAKELVSELGAYVPDNSPVAIFCLHNRRNTESGRFIADKMLEATVNAVCKSSSLKYVKTVNIRDALNSEVFLENSKQLTKPRFYPLLKNAEYVIIGGVSLFDNFAKASTRPVRENTDED